MRCIIVDDEPIAREGIKLLIKEIPQLALLKSFNNAEDASVFINDSSFASEKTYIKKAKGFPYFVGN